MRKKTLEIKSPEKLITEYELGVRGEDRPKWPEPRMRTMIESYKEVAPELSEVNKKVREWCRENNIPQIEKVKFFAVARKAWSLLKRDVSQIDYEKRLKNLCDELNVDVRKANSLLKYLGFPAIGSRRR